MNQKVGRNDLCPCGSGKKYKNCCMNKESEPKKVYTPSGKRKFKAKVIDSSLGSQDIFAQAAGNVPVTGGSPDVLRKLRFRMSEHDYREGEQEASEGTVESAPIVMPTAGSQPVEKPGSDFQATSDDFRVEKK